MKTALSGPLIVYGQRPPKGVGATGSNNPDLGPSLVYGGVGLLDPRLQYNRTRSGALGFLGTTGIPLIDAVPSTISAVNISASASPGAGAIALVTSSGAGITVLASALTVWPSGNVIPAGSLAIDGAPGIVNFGLPSVSNGNTAVGLYDPTKSLARAVRITSGGSDSGINFTVNGYDVYGYPMTQTLAGAAIGVVTTTKCFKFITSITHTGTVAGTLSVGTADVFGFPLRVDTINYVEMSWNGSTITANTGFTGADATSPATASTGDVRGSYAVQSASDGSKRLQVFATPSVANVGSVTGLFGQTQV